MEKVTNRAISEFVNTFKSMGRYKSISVRNPRIANEQDIELITSERHTHEVVAYDILGNMTVLTKDGQCKQYITNDEIKDALNSRNLENQVLSEYNHCILIAVVEDGKEVIEYVMSNQETGSTHTLTGNSEDTPRERLLAHWSGFIGTEYPPAIKVVQFTNKKPFLPYYNTLGELKEEITRLRDFDMVRERAKAVDSPTVRGRGVDFLFMSKGERIDGFDINWNGTRQDIIDVVENALSQDSNIDEVWLSGGYDCAASPFAMNCGDYEPNIHVWDVLLWDDKSDFAPFDFLRL